MSSVAPVIQSSVAADDLAPIIKVHLGEDPDNGGTAQDALNTPYNVATSDMNDAALGTPAYQPLSDAMSALDAAIIQADPSSDLQEVAKASQAVVTACIEAHALP
jgi:hypothetical protein